MKTALSAWASAASVPEPPPTMTVRASSKALPRFLLLVLLACGGDAGTGPTGGGGSGPASIVTVTPASASIPEGGSVQLTATAEDAQGQTVSTTFTWTSQNTTVASVTGSGLVTGIDAGETTVTAEADGVTGTAAITVEAAPPDAPGDLTAEPVSATEIELRWTDRSDDEVGFEVERSLQETSGFAPVATVGADVTTYTDSGLDVETTYYYRVRAVGEDETTSDYSDVAQATTLGGLAGTLAEVERLLEELMPPPGTPFESRDLVEELRVLAMALLEVPEVITTRVDPNSQTLQIDRIDGTSVLVANSRPPHPGEAFAHVPGPAAAMAPGDLGHVGPPGSKDAVWVSIDGGASVGAEVGGLLASAGYDVSHPVGTLEDMRQFSGLGALYLDTHGVVWTQVTDVILDAAGKAVGKVDGETMYGLQTESLVEVAEFASLEEELENGEIVLTYSQNASTEQWQAKLAVTHRFIQKYWSFEDAVVMIHACNAGRGPVPEGWDCFGLCDPDEPYDPTPIRTTVLGQGADVVVAFDNITWPTNARRSILYFFDRLLGTNEYDPEVVPQRPFDLASVMGGMQEKDLLSFKLGSHDVNVTFDVADSRVTLAPSIEKMDIVDDAAQSDGELTLHGIFGGAAGAVEVDGVEAPVQSWTDDQVVARVPFEGAGSSGDVVVVKPDGVESNGVPLTEWRGKMTFTFEPGTGSLKAEVEVDTRFRADVHAYREQIDGPTTERSVTAYISPASTGQSTGTGSYITDGTTITYERSEPLQILSRAQVDAGLSAPGDQSVFGGLVTLDPSAGTARICVAVYGYVTVRVKNDDGEAEARQLMLQPFADLFTSFEGLPCLDLPLQEGTYAIPDGQNEIAVEDATFRLKWETFQPLSPPSDDTAG